MSPTSVSLQGGSVPLSRHPCRHCRQHNGTAVPSTPSISKPLSHLKLTCLLKWSPSQPALLQLPPSLLWPVRGSGLCAGGPPRGSSGLPGPPASGSGAAPAGSSRPPLCPGRGSGGTRRRRSSRPRPRCGGSPRRPAPRARSPGPSPGGTGGSGGVCAKGTKPDQSHGSVPLPAALLPAEFACPGEQAATAREPFARHSLLSRPR